MFALLARPAIPSVVALVALTAACAEGNPPPPEGEEGGAPPVTVFTGYHFRSALTIEGAPDGQAVAFELDHAALVRDDKALPDGADVRIGYEDADGLREVARVREPITAWDSPATVLWFKTAGAGQHYLYYGKPKADAPDEDLAAMFDAHDGFDGDMLDEAWTLYPVGEASGEVTVADGVAHLRGATGDIQGGADSMVLLARELSGDFRLEVALRATGGSLGAGSVAGGLMARQSPLEDARFVMGARQDVPAGRLSGVRVVDGEDAALTAELGDAVLPLIFSLERQGDVFSAATSPDGIRWTAVGEPYAVEMINPVLVGVPLANISGGAGYVDTDYARMRSAVVPTPGVEVGAEEAL